MNFNEILSGDHQWDFSADEYELCTSVKDLHLLITKSADIGRDYYYFESAKHDEIDECLKNIYNSSSKNIHQELFKDIRKIDDIYTNSLFDDGMLYEASFEGIFDNLGLADQGFELKSDLGEYSEDESYEISEAVIEHNNKCFELIEKHLNNIIETVEKRFNDTTVKEQEQSEATHYYILHIYDEAAELEDTNNLADITSDYDIPYSIEGNKVHDERYKWATQKFNSCREAEDFIIDQIEDAYSCGGHVVYFGADKDEIKEIINDYLLLNSNQKGTADDLHEILKDLEKTNVIDKQKTATFHR